MVVKTKKLVLGFHFRAAAISVSLCTFHLCIYPRSTSTCKNHFDPIRRGVSCGNEPGTSGDTWAAHIEAHDADRFRCVFGGRLENGKPWSPTYPNPKSSLTSGSGLRAYLQGFLRSPHVQATYSSMPVDVKKGAKAGFRGAEMHP